MQHIETVVLGSAAASITFSSIPADYTDLVLVHSIRTTAGVTGDQMLLTINSSTANFTGRALFGNGSTATSESAGRQAGETPGNNATASTFGNATLYFPNYTSSANKSFSVDSTMENNATFSLQKIYAGLWSDSSAITSLQLTSANSGNLAANSSASLYGILAGSDGTTVVS